MHAEVGYLRPVGTTGVELVLAHPSGIAEIQSGTLEGQRIRLETTSVGLAPTSKDVRSLTRSIDVAEGHMHYVIEMAAVSQDLQFHLEATLHHQA